MSLFGGNGGMFGGGWNNPNFGPMPLNRQKNPWWRQLGQWGNNPFGNYSQQHMNQTGGMGGNTLDPNGVGGPGPFGGGSLGGGGAGGAVPGGPPWHGEPGHIHVPGDENRGPKAGGGSAGGDLGFGGAPDAGAAFAHDPYKFNPPPPSPHGGRGGGGSRGGVGGGSWSVFQNPLDDIWAQRAALQREQAWQAQQAAQGGQGNITPDMYPGANQQQGQQPANIQFSSQQTQEFPGFGGNQQMNDLLELIKNQYAPEPFTPGTYAPVEVEQVQSDADPMAVIRSTLPTIRHATQMANAGAAARLGAGGMGASSAYAGALGQNAAQEAHKTAALYMDQLGRHAENQAGRDQQRRMQEANFRQQGQLFDRDEAFNSWRSFEDISQRGAGGLMQLLRMFGGG